MLRQGSTCSNRQHHSGAIHKQCRRHEAGPTLCPTMENIDLVYQKSSNSQSLTHSRPAERGSRQAIQARPDHPNRVVSLSRGLPDNLQQVAPAKNRPYCHEVQQQVASVCFTDTGSPGHSTQSAMGGLGRICLPTSSILGKVVEKLKDSPCKTIILIAPGWPNMPWFWDLVAMSSHSNSNSLQYAKFKFSHIPLSLLFLPNQLTQLFNQIPHRNLTNLNLHAWLLEPQQLKSRASLRQWQQALGSPKGIHQISL